MGAPSIANPFKDPLKFVTQAAMAPIVLPIAATAAGGKYVAEATAEGVGLKKTDAQKAAEEASNEANARTAAYNEAISGGGIDRISQQEIARLYQSGASSSDIANTLAAARSGKGIYAVRQINQNQAEYAKNNPGRRATVRSLGYGSAI